jgi:hypothetical protein
MGACGRRRRSRSTVDPRTILPMIMDESRPHPLVSYFSCFHGEKHKRRRKNIERS